jgi:hypothetical protein
VYICEHNGWTVGSMRARSKLRPGQPGTHKLVAQYGDRLVCVRYRYDAVKRRRYTTAEIVVRESEWDPLPSATARRQIVAVRVELQETVLREKVKAAGGRWNPEDRVWHLPMEQVLQLGLESRVVRQSDAVGKRDRAGNPSRGATDVCNS